MKKNNIVVLGGGTAGWLTALFAKNVFPEKNITLIQSSKVGTIGVGKGPRGAWRYYAVGARGARGGRGGSVRGRQALPPAAPPAARAPAAGARRGGGL